MIKNYLKIAWTIIKRNKSYTFINMMGLSLGIASAIIIFLIVDFQLSFNQDNKNADNIYRIVTDFHYSDGSLGHSGGAPLPMGAALRNDYSFLANVATVKGLPFAQIAVMGEDNVPVKKFQEQNPFASKLAFTESNLFDIFDYTWLTTNAAKTLDEPNNVVITEKLAHKYFDNDNAIGKILRMDNKIDLKITGILKDIPTNTDLQYEVFISWPTLKSFDSKASDNWFNINSAANCYVLAKNASIQQLAAVLPTFGKKYLSEKDAKAKQFKPQPLSDIHYNPHYGGHVNKTFLWAFIWIGLFLIISACVNFINMATAQAMQRAKEIGVRKVIGGTKMQLFGQFMLETGLITVFAVVIAIVLANFLLPSVNTLFAGVFEIVFNPKASFFVFLGVLTLSIIFLSGAYPAFILSGFKPIMALKGKISAQQVGRIPLRRGLVVMQFFITQLLIICTIVIASQMNYSKNMDLGFDKNGILLLQIPQPDKTKMETLRNQLTQISAVQNASLNYTPPSYRSSSSFSKYQYSNKKKDEDAELNMKYGDENYLSTFGLTLVAGQNFQKRDSATEAIVNEKFAQTVGEKSANDAIGKTLTINDKTLQIVGVVKDFHTFSAKEEIYPTCIIPQNQKYGWCAVKLNAHNLLATLPTLEKTWNSIYPEYAYKTEWLDDNIAQFYLADNIMLRFIRGFSVIAILIGCLGLYGLVMFIAAQKAKEIGIRKVLGASVANIIGIFSKEFITLIVIAFAVAAPLAWWAMSQWLNGFVYRIHLGMGVFILAISITLLIAAITIAHQAIKAAVANPVKSLRTE